MGDKSYLVKSSGQSRDETLLKKHKTLEVISIDEDDTITVTGYTTINSVKVVNLADCVDVSSSVVGNVVTIDEVDLSAEHVIILVVGS